MKFQVFAFLVPAALAATCGDVAEGSRPRAFDCGELELDVSKLDVVCSVRSGCTEATCCKETRKPEDEAPAPLVMDPDEKVCGRAQGSQRKSRHVCSADREFDQTQFYTPCGAQCSDDLCCTKKVWGKDPMDCYTDESKFSTAKRALCCITEGVACAPKTCSFGAGIISDDGLTCCHVSCGTCGGQGCYYRGGPACCQQPIRDSGRSCSMYPAPCAMDAPYVDYRDMWTRRAAPFPVFEFAAPHMVHPHYSPAMHLCKRRGFANVGPMSFEAAPNPFAMMPSSLPAHPFLFCN